MEFSRQENWSVLRFPTPGILLTQESNLCPLNFLDWWVDSFNVTSPGKTQIFHIDYCYLIVKSFLNFFMKSDSCSSYKIMKSQQASGKSRMIRGYQILSRGGTSEMAVLLILALVFLYSQVIFYDGEGHGNPLQQSCLENSMDRGSWWATVHGVTKTWT